MNLRISAGDVKLVDRSSSKAGLSERLLLRRIPGAKTPAAVVQLASSATEKRKCTKVSLSLSCLDANLSSDISLVDDLVAVSKLPPGEFLDVIPTDTTIIEMDASDITVKLVPRTLRSSVAVFCERMSLGTKLRQGAVHTKYKADVSNVQVWIADTLRGEDDRRRTFKVGARSLLALKPLTCLHTAGSGVCPARALPRRIS